MMPRLKSSIPAGFCKLHCKLLLEYNLPHTDKEMHKAFYGKYNRVFCTCTNSVYQASPRGGGGGAGNDAKSL